MARLLMTAMLVSGCSDDNPEFYAVDYTETREVCDHRNPLRNAYFGDLHVHTGYSFDAWANDIHTLPEDAYAFARGESVALPPLDANGNGTLEARLERPLDFVAVTDHAEFLGEVQICTDPSAAGYDSSSCVQLREATRQSIFAFGFELAPTRPERFEFCTAGDCVGRARGVWQRIRDAAEQVYDRTSACGFSSFIAYEWSGATNSNNLHRNIIFRNDTVPESPASYFEQPRADGLWRELESSCLNAASACDVLAIPHNSNLSSGNMFRARYPGEGSDEQQAKRRRDLEPLVEIFQHKGDSECMNDLSGAFGAPDEYCAFEKYNVASPDCGDNPGGGGLAGFGCVSRYDFVRNVLALGLVEKQRFGINPFKLGIVASTDTHNSTPGLVSETKWPGHTGKTDDTAGKRVDGPTLPPGGVLYNPGGLAGVWAQENSRDAIFQAMRRRETWGTSGPRIVVRFFGGFGLHEDLCDDVNLVTEGYKRGVPMGRDMRGDGETPVFVVQALRDPGTDAYPGTPLERVQIIKGWVDKAGDAHTEVFNVKVDRGNFSTDPASCGSTGGGASTLCGTWKDEKFAPKRQAFYYARVLEYPTCRWSSYACDQTEPRPAGCDDPDLPRLIQERAWTSPIWYEPEE